MLCIFYHYKNVLNECIINYFELGPIQLRYLNPINIHRVPTVGNIERRALGLTE